MDTLTHRSPESRNTQKPRIKKASQIQRSLINPLETSLCKSRIKLSGEAQALTIRLVQFHAVQLTWACMPFASQ